MSKRDLMPTGEKRETQPKNLQVESRETNKDAINYDGCSANLPKGATVDLEQKLSQGIVVADTGAFAAFLEKYDGQNEFSQEDVDNIYIKSILSGAIDHHSIDSFLSEKGTETEKCATKMVVDYKEAVLQLIKEKKIKGVETHFDSDMDAIASSYLIKSLIESGKLPVIAEDLAELTNKVDYGRLSTAEMEFADPKVYANSLPGTIDSIKAAIDKECGGELGKSVFSNPAMKGPGGRLNAEGVKLLGEIKAKYENKRNALVFQLLNAINQQKISNPDFNIGRDINEMEEKFSEEMRAYIESGRPMIMKNYEVFSEDFSKAERNKAAIKDKKGNDIDANVVVAESKDPLLFTNLAYTRTSPDSIIAVYAGKERKGGDMYDIGITPDQANTMDLRGLCLSLNKAEKAKRDAIYAKPEDGRSPEEQELIKNWEGQGDRDVFSGIKEMISKGEISEDDVLKKDPTVLVANGSLIAASRTSLLTPEEFKKVIKDFFEIKK